MKKLIAGAGILVISLQLGVIQVFAQNNSLWPSEWAGIKDPDVLVRNLIRLMFLIAGVVVLFFLIWGGLKWITSGGDKAQTETARNTLTAAIIGMAIIALSYVLIRILETFFGINITTGGILNQINSWKNQP